MHAHFRTLLICAGLAAAVQLGAAQVPFAFTPVQLDLPDLNYGKMSYADVDGDGDLDVLAAGNAATSIPFRPSAYVALGGEIVPISLFNNDPKREFEVLDLPGNGVWSSDAKWLDYNSDGILDAIVTGTTHSAAPYETRPFEGSTLLLKGKADGGFESVGLSIPGVYGGSVAPGDVDNDGDEDLLVSGLRDPSRPYTRLFHNVDGEFRLSSQRFEALALGESKWVDLDADGDLDLVHSGINASNSVHSLIYLNDGQGRFTRMEGLLPDLVFGSTDWGDYDNDGDLDVAVSGAVLDPLEILVPMSGIYQNNGMSFTLVTNTQIPDVFYGSMGWADYDNDGDLDLLVSGATNMSNGREARIFRQENGYFVNRIWLPAVAAGSASWGDFDGNDVVDLLLSGSNRSVQPLSRLYRNEIRSANSRPLPPTSLNVDVSNNSVTLSWDAGSDQQTAEAGLMYNLRVASQPGADDVMPAFADAETGRRRVTGPGNVWQARSRTFRLSQGMYYWSVQTVDQAYAGSEFAEEVSFQVSNSPGLGTSTEEQPQYEYDLLPSYPNPFVDAATIPYSLREPGQVQLDVYNMLGQRVRGLVAEYQTAGRHQITWRGAGEQGGRVAAGVYFVRLIAGGQEWTERLVLVR